MTETPRNPSDQPVRIRRHGYVAELVLDRPEAMNAMSTGLAEALVRAGAELADDKEIRSVVLSSSSEKAFCVGADLKERATLTDADLLAQRPLVRRAYAAVLELPVPTIAAVSGYALGGGCELALGCDIIAADDGAVFGLPEVSVGVIPGGGGTQLLVRRVGSGRAADLIFTARRLGADEAASIGLVDRRVAGHGTATATALEIAGGIAAHSPVALRNAKRALRVGADLPLAAGLDVEDGAWRATAFSADRAEGVLAFVEKRAPRWPSGS